MSEIMKENVEDLLSANLWLALPSEFLATLVITLFGCGTWSSRSGDVHVALTFGLAVASVVWIFNHISGGHANPAVTLAALITRRVSIIRGVLYVVAQVVGAITGAGILYGLSSGRGGLDLGVNLVRDGLTAKQGFGVELLITFVYVLTVFASFDDKRTDTRGSAPLTIGLAASLGHLFAVPYTRAGMNPARSFGPALIVSEWSNHWVFWVGPLVGGTLAGLLYEYVLAADASLAGLTKCLLRTKRPRRPQAQDTVPLEEVKGQDVDTEQTKLVESKNQEGDGVEGVAQLETEVQEVEQPNK